MQLSDRTVSVLKNFASINPNLVIVPGKELKTISVARNVMSKVTLDEQFDSSFGIYDLNEFLSVLSLVDDPNLKIEEQSATISDSNGRSNVKYFFSDPDMLTSPNKDIVMPECEVNFVLDSKTLGSLKSAAAVLGHQEISILPSNGTIQLAVLDTKNSTSNVFSVEVDGSFSGEDKFNFVLNVNNLKVLNEDYDVHVSSKLISHFKSKQSSIEYFIALEKTSTYGE